MSKKLLNIWVIMSRQHPNINTTWNPKTPCKQASLRPR